MKKYEGYKDSEIKWLGKVPEHWEVRRIKDISDKVGSGITPKGGAEVYSDYGIMFFRSQNIQNKKLDYRDIAYISNKIDRKMSSTRIRQKDILLNITGASIGRCFYVSSNIKGNVNQHVCIIRPKQHKIDTRSLHYSIISPYGQNLIMFCQNGANREGLSFQLINNFEFLIPPIEEQISIANYLDSKTQLIDQKIELLDNKVRKYRELRKTIINEAVCRGLDRNTKLVDSGVEWIGKVPEHWGVRRFKSFANTIKGKNLEYYDTPFTDSLPNLSLEYLRNNLSCLASYCYCSDKKLKVNNDDLIIIWDGAGVGEILKAKKGYLSSTIAKLIFTKECNSKFFYFFRDILEFTLKKIPAGMGIPHLNPVVLNNYKFPLPPLKEQIEIADFLEEKSRMMDSIINNIQQQITKLQELRKTLINDVVTGKIKVTG